MKLSETIRLSKKATLSNLYQNVFIAPATVTMLLLGVLFGRLHMAGGMLLHEASVLIVIPHRMRLLPTKTASEQETQILVLSRQATAES